MISLLVFMGTVILLTIEGWCLLGVLGLQKGSLKFALSLPIAALSSTLLVALLTLAGEPLTLLSIFSTHFILIITAVILKRPKTLLLPKAPAARTPLWIIIPCTLILTALGIYSVAHSVILPTFHYDSAVNWNMRSKVSFTEHNLVLTSSHPEILKPHYPFLYHSLQITTQQGQPAWNEAAANTIFFLLLMSAVTALFLIVRSLRGAPTALLSVTLITSTPLFAIHLGGGYADIPLVLFALLSLATFFLFEEAKDARWLLFSAIFVSACVWTKSEGLPFCLLPWLLLLSQKILQKKQERNTLLLSGGLALMLALPWPLMAMAKGLSLSPHGGNDLGIGYFPGALTEAINVLFTLGSFGVVLPLVLLVSLLSLRTKRPCKAGMVWGLLSFAGVLFVYLCTKNAEYLLNGQSFDRQLLLPNALLLLSLTLMYAPRATQHSHLQPAYTAREN